MKKYILIIALSLLGQLTYSGSKKSLLNKTLRLLKLNNKPLEERLLKAIEENRDITGYLNSEVNIGTKINVNIKSHLNEITPLHIAAKCNNVDAIYKLIKAGANIEAKTSSVDDYSYTPLHVAIIYNNLNAAILLIDKGADINARDIRGNTPLHWGVLLSYSGIRPIMDIDKLILLIQRGADINAKDNEGATPLALSVAFNKLNALTRLLKAGADINTKDNNDNTPLHLAIHTGNIDIIKELLEKNVDINAKGNNEATPLHLAILKLENLNIFRLLIEKGSSINSKDNNGNTPLHCAAQKGNLSIITELLELGAKSDTKNNCNITPLTTAKEQFGIDSKAYEALLNLSPYRKSINNLFDIDHL